jgi:hypothetical protein
VGREPLLDRLAGAGQAEAIEFVDGLGYETNIHDVPDLEEFFQAVLLPVSLSSRFVGPRAPAATPTPAAY